jgi:gamma-glutamylaminecyclotransferase
MADNTGGADAVVRRQLMNRIFVFGTLKRRFPLHAQGLDGARCLGPYRTAERFPMFVAGPWFGPMMLDQPGTGLQVRGELYEVDDPRLALIDALESVGEPGNFRRLVQLEPVEGGDACWALAYMKSPELATPAHTGYLEDYQDRRFVPPDRRG